MAYPNLRAEMARNNISQDNIIELTKCNRKTLYNRLYCTSHFPIDEAATIRCKYFPLLSYEYLFKYEDEADSGKEQDERHSKQTGATAAT